MNLKRSIKRVAGFLRVGVDFERVKMLYGSNPEDVGLRRDYLRECKRRNEDPEIYDEWLMDTYGIGFNFDTVEHIKLNGMNIEDFSFLDGVVAPNLRTLTLESCSIGTFEGISGFEAPNIENISLWGNHIRSSCKGFSECTFPSLVSMEIQDNTFSSVKGLSGFTAPKLEILDLNANRGLELGELSNTNFSSLRRLTLVNAGLNTLEDLSKIRAKNLKILVLNYNGLKTLEGLRGRDFPYLMELSIGNNSISSLEGLENFKYLEEVNIRVNPIKVTKKEIKRYGLIVEPNQIMEE